VWHGDIHEVHMVGFVTCLGGEPICRSVRAFRRRALSLR
jgi:hypothetical protein